MLNPPCHKVAQWDFMSSYSMKPCETNIERKMLGCWACSLAQKFQLSSANTKQTIETLFAQYWGQLWPNSPTFARLYK